MDISIRIAGKAGQGIQSISSIIAKTFVRHDFYVFINQDVESRIRGGHNFDQVRISDTPSAAAADDVDILIALDKETIRQDISSLSDNGVLLYDGDMIGFKSDAPKHLSMPLAQIATEVGKNKLMVSSAAIGAMMAILGFGLQTALDCLQEQFLHKGAEIIQLNRKTTSAGYDFARENIKTWPDFKIPRSKLARKKMLLTGSQSMALGAMASGLKLYSGYPMSPATPIMEFIAKHAERYNIVCEQAEDEIAAINMAIGANFAGVRSMTATSGGGFCLMAEALSLAGMTETPVVLVVAQRPGPSTGLPTRTEQADFNFVMHAGHGEFPRVIMAPGYPEQAFYLMTKAFNLADRYQTPIIVLGDQHFNDSFFTVDELNLQDITIDRGQVLADKDLDAPRKYKRYAYSKSGISPRILPGQTKAVLYADSDEHSEEGHITEKAGTRRRMMDKRMQKFEGLRQNMEPPEIYPSGPADLALLGWGSTHGAIKEAVERLNQDGLSAQMIHYSQLFPLDPQHLAAATLGESNIIAVENNFNGQFADYFENLTGLAIGQKILKYDGRPFTCGEIIHRIKEMV
jgi:2-oxoglutarate/2-oxoacid ferredoxin oxidoreductase subunit alpha